MGAETITAGAVRAQRADARRNAERILAEAREVFAESGPDASLEEIARRAGVGIGTLYRHFPTRRHLLEAVYVDEVEAISRSATELGDLPPWDALVTWLRRFVDYAETKRALAQELFTYVDRDAAVFQTCRAAINGAGEPLLARAQEAGIVRPDVSFSDLVRLVASIAALPSPDEGQVDRVLDLALDGLRYRPA